jgi:hypothetical protein
MRAKAGLAHDRQLTDINVIYFYHLELVPALVPTNRNPYKNQTPRVGTK